MTQSPDTLLSRKGGRPARISRDSIVARALELLETEGFEAFSMPRLGKAMGVSSMALYKHYPSRDALLEAVVAHIVGYFDFTDGGEAWDIALGRWFNAYFDLFERFPVAVRLQKWEQREVSEAWLKVWAPVALIMKRRGIAGQDLAFATSWTSTVALGLVSVHCSPQRSERPTLFSHSSGDAAMDAAIAEVDGYFGKLGRRQIMDFGARAVIESIDRHFGGDTAR